MGTPVRLVTPAAVGADACIRPRVDASIDPYNLYDAKEGHTMIYCLTGKIIKKTLDSVVISCGGVGYFVQIPATTGEALPPVGKEGTVYTIMNVTENDVSLYGFATEEQRDCFKMLTAVTGVGPKAGLSILSIMTPEKIALAASSEITRPLPRRPALGPSWPSASRWN